MIVSWDWLSEYVRLDMPLDELTERLTMSGLNLEGTESIDGDAAVDLEVTSNRPDCLGHLGVAREVGVLYDLPLSIPAANPKTVSESVDTVTSVQVDCPELCPRYTARVVRGVTVGPSPDWLVGRLATLGIASINNVVDITNYVLMETGQPLHAFDFDKLSGQRIVVRTAKKGETFVAINHATFELQPEMCVIADAETTVALGGVMGGAATEIGEQTTTVLIETAEFAPLSIRNTARQLSLFSDSSFRFERGIDPHGIDYASRRCCQLILELAGGELLDGVAWTGAAAPDDDLEVTLRFAQVPRVLGIDIDPEDSVSILESLGLETTGDPDRDTATFRIPSWRRDLEREIDLIEEVARIHGYDEIPEDSRVPLTLSSRTHRDRVLDPLRDHFCATGFYEAITLTFVTPELQALFQPEPDRQPLAVEHSSRRKENLLRQSLVPSLLQSRRENERHGNFGVDLFEIANVYLEADPGQPGSEPTRVAAVCGRSFAELKGVIVSLLEHLAPHARLTTRPGNLREFVTGRGAEILLDGDTCGWLGELSRDITDQLGLRDSVTVLEIDLEPIEELVELNRHVSELPRFPAVDRDLNFLLNEDVTWEQLETSVRHSAGPLLNSVSFGGQYVGQQIPEGRKSYIITIGYRSDERTLTNEEVEESQAKVVDHCQKTLDAMLR